MYRFGFLRDTFSGVVVRLRFVRIRRERGAPLDHSELARERRARRAAEAKGLRLHKSAVRDPDDYDFGRWWVVLPRGDRPQDWRWSGRWLTPTDGIYLSEVEAFVAGYVDPSSGGVASG